MSNRSCQALMLLAAAGLASAAQVATCLSGVVSFGANANGASITEPGENDNTVGTGNLQVVINGQPRGTTFLLADGVTHFTFTGVGASCSALSPSLGAAVRRRWI